MKNRQAKCRQRPSLRIPLFAGASDLRGNGVPGSTVAIVINDEQVATAEVEKDGSWSVPVELQSGTQTIVLQTIADDGSVLDETEPVELTVQEPIPPTVDLPPGNVYAYGLTLTGTGQPNSEVQVIANEVAVANVKVNDDGTWSAEVNLVAGSYNIDAGTLDLSGNIIEQIPALSLPVLPLPGPQLRPTQPDVTEFDPLSGVFLLKGVAEPGSTVGILANNELVGSTTAGDNGRWSLESNLDPGNYDLAVGEIDGSGIVAEPSAPTSIDLTQLPPSLELPQESLDESDPDAPTVNVTAGVFILNGQAEPNSQVAILVDKQITVTAAADETGGWSTDSPVEAGEHELQLGVVGENGDIISISEPLPLNVSPSPEPAMDPLVLDSSNGDATVSGTTSPDTTVNLQVNGAVLATTTSDAAGSFSFDIRLSPGSYELQVQTVAADGSVEYESAAETVEIPPRTPLEAGETAPSAGDSSSAESTQSGSEEEHAIAAAEKLGNFSTLLAGLEAAGLTGVLADADEPYTLTAPTDDAFAALPEEVIAAWDQYPESYAEILYYLVLEGRYTEEELLQAQVLTTIGGTNIGITTDGENTLINGVPIVSSIPAGTSIVHAVNQVILPPLGYTIQPPIVNESGVPIFTGTYLTVVGTAEPGKQILLQVSGENFGEIVTVNEDGSWQVSDDITSGVHDILAYMLDDNGTLMAISQLVSLPVQ